MRVESVSPHNQNDSAAAILGSYSGSFGIPTDRAQMVYLDADRVGWADDTQSTLFHVADGATTGGRGWCRHPRRRRHPRADAKRLRGDGRIAIGDQMNDPSVESALQIRSVTLLCP